MRVALLLAATGLTGGWVVWHLLRRREERLAFLADRERYRVDEERAEMETERQRLVEFVRQGFPHAVEDLESRLDARDAGDVPLQTVLGAVPGVRIGVTNGGLPVVLPLAGRTRHLCGWGRTGTGKTSVALRLMCDDIAAGRGLVVLGTEHEFFRDHLLPRVPESRADDVVYFAPARADCTVSWNPFEVSDEDRARAALELFTVFRRVLNAESLGPQSDPIARNTFLALAGMPGATFLTAREFVENRELRTRLLPKIEDPWCRRFWERRFPTFSRGASRPFLNRLELFAGAAPGVRRTLCRPRGSLSLGNSIDSGKLLFVDLSGFDAETTRILGQLVLAYLQIAIDRRERMPERERRLCMLYADELAEIAGSSGAAETFRLLWSKGRRYGVAISAFSQFPGQLDAAVRAEIFGNSATVLSLAVAAQEANFIRRELLLPAEEGPAESVAAEELVSLPVGCGYIRLGTGALAVPVRLDPPLEAVDSVRGDEIRARSWARFAEAEPAGPLTDPAFEESPPEWRPEAPPAAAAKTPTELELTPEDRRLLAAVLASPGRNSSEYAKLAKMSGAAAVASRQRLVEAGYLREHHVATGRRGRQAIVLEPAEPASGAPTPEKGRS